MWDDWDYRRIRTHLVRALLRRTPWEERESIHDLMRLEAFIVLPPGSVASARVHDILRRRYPAEAEAIRLELEEGTPVPLERLPQLAADLEAAERASAEARAQRQALEEERCRQAREVLYQRWREAGGLP